MSTTPSITLPTETLSNEKKPRFSLVLPRKPSPPTKVTVCKNTISTLCVPEENNSSRSFSSGYSGGYYYSSGENLNGSSGFSQSGGGHHNFYGRVDRLR
jgi:hypothetical protein